MFTTVDQYTRYPTEKTPVMSSPSARGTHNHCFSLTNCITHFPITKAAMATCLALASTAANATSLNSDFDGDARSDVAVFRPITGEWYILPSSGSCPPHFRALPAAHGGCATQYGLPGDVPVSNDYSGDGRADVGVYRPSTQTWFFRYANGAPDSSFQFGVPGGKPAPQSTSVGPRSYIGFFGPNSLVFDVTDPLTGNWQPRSGIHTPDGTVSWAPILARNVYGQPVLFKRELSGLPVTTFGGVGNFAVDFFEPHPAAAFYADVDGRWIGLQRAPDYVRFNGATAEWSVTDRRDLLTTKRVQWGLPGDTPLLGDWDGDGVQDITVLRHDFPYAGFTTFFAKTSSTDNPGGWTQLGDGGYYKSWGLNGDIPIGAEINQL